MRVLGQWEELDSYLGSDGEVDTKSDVLTAQVVEKDGTVYLRAKIKDKYGEQRVISNGAYVSQSLKDFVSLLYTSAVGDRKDYIDVGGGHLFVIDNLLNAVEGASEFMRPGPFNDPDYWAHWQPIND